jgi:hypothetical protein
MQEGIRSGFGERSPHYHFFSWIPSFLIRLLALVPPARNQVITTAIANPIFQTVSIAVLFEQRLNVLVAEIRSRHRDSLHR